VWFSGTFGECDGEDSQRGDDCAIETLHMGEIRGDALSYFARTPKQWVTLKSIGLVVGLLFISAAIWVIKSIRSSNPSIKI